MNIAVILAAGNSARIKNYEIPKQFVMVGKHPVIIHSIQTFLQSDLIDEIIVVCHPVWIEHLNGLISGLKFYKSITVIPGEKNRNGSLLNAIKYIEKNVKINDEDIILTHDGVRMFFNGSMIESIIKHTAQFGACNLVRPVIDTICKATNDHIIEVPDRQNLYSSQTPQTFKWKIIYDTYINHYNENTTDACTMILDAKYPVSILINNTFNFKITTDDDFAYANYLVETKNK